MRATSEPLTGLVKQINERMSTVTSKNHRTPGVFVIFDSKVEGLDKELQAIDAKESLKWVSLCIGTPPKDYEVASEAEVTVSIYNIARRGEQRVTANFALRKGELDGIKTDAIVNALSAMLPK